MSARRKLLRRASTAPGYAKTFRKLGECFAEWIGQRMNIEVLFSFPEGVELLGPIEALPESCIISEGARGLWKFCCEHCPDATCLMFHELVERVTEAALAQGVGIAYRSTTGDA